jgi:hypothetical protein
VDHVRVAGIAIDIGRELIEAVVVANGDVAADLDQCHLPLDTMASFVIGDLTRHIDIRADYGAYEYTTYLYRAPFGV